MVRLSFQFPSNNLGVIQLDGGYVLLASPLFALQSLSQYSVSCLSTSQELIPPPSATGCLQLSIFGFCAFFLLRTTWKLPCYPWFLKLTAATIICHCLDSHIEKGKEEVENGKKKGCVCQKAQNILSPLSYTLLLSCTHHKSAIYHETINSERYYLNVEALEKS